MPRPSTPSTLSLNVKISAETHGVLKQAAELKGTSVRAFAADALEKYAKNAIDGASTITLSRADQIIFVSALLDPPAPVPALRRAAARYRKLVGA